MGGPQVRDLHNVRVVKMKLWEFWQFPKYEGPPGRALGETLGPVSDPATWQGLGVPGVPACEPGTARIKGPQLAIYPFCF